MKLPPVRPLTDADLAAAAAIERETFADPWSRSAFAETLRRPEVLGVAQDGPDGTLIGYALCAAMGPEGEVLNIAVSARSRRGGAGRALAGAMVRWLVGQGARKVYLEVRRSNAPAIALYEQLGFGRLGVRRGYYTDPREDALTMVLNVTPDTAK